jgi:hypothetical protein
MAALSEKATTDFPERMNRLAITKTLPNLQRWSEIGQKILKF